MSRFTFVFVAKSPKATSLLGVYIGTVDPSGRPTGVTPDGTVIPLRGNMACVTASHQSSSARRGQDIGAFSISMKDVQTSRYAAGDGKRPISTLLERLDANPWNNKQAKVLATLLRG